MWEGGRQGGLRERQREQETQGVAAMPKRGPCAHGYLNGELGGAR